MKLYDFEQLKAVDLEEDMCNIVYTHFVFERETLSNYTTFVKVVRDYVRGMVRQAQDKENTYFDIEVGGDFSDEEYKAFIAVFGAALVEELVLKENRRAEDRLKCNNSKMNLSYGLMLRLVNKCSKIKCFGFGVHYNGCVTELVEG